MFLLILFLNFSFTCIKTSKNSSAKYYQDHKERLKACESYQSLSQKNNWQYDHKRYKNLSEDEKQQLVEFRKNY